jgi:aryl-alcohol dehydrogenase-like predicted oxidoreductase
MKYARLGTAGLKVSRVGLGCQPFGPPERRTRAMDEREAHVLIKHAIDRGINYFDTSNSYSHGVSEEILGRAIPDVVPREGS